MKSILKRVLRPGYTWALNKLKDKLKDILLDLNNSHLSTINIAAEFVVFNQIEGDYLEFGVYSGRSFMQSYQNLEKNRAKLGRLGVQLGHDSYEYMRHEVRYFAFDSFEGLPKIEGTDLTDKAPEHWRQGDASTTKEEFLEVLNRNGLDLNKVSVIEGWFNSTLTDDTKKRLEINKAAMVHIDCDFFESTVPCLDFITDLIHDGTVIIFDDWFRFKNDPKLGVQGATMQWLDKNPHIKLTDLARHSAQSLAFIVNLRYD